MDRIPLRVGLVLDSFDQPRWVHTLLSGLRTEDETEITVILRLPTKSSKAPIAGSVLTGLYGALDRALFARQTDALTMTDLSNSIAGIDVISEPGDASLQAPRESPRVKLTDEVSTFLTDRADVLLDLVPLGRPTPDEAPIPILAFRPRDTPISDASIGLYEVLNRAPHTDAVVERIAPGNGRRVVYHAYCSTHPYSAHITHRNLVAKAPDLFMREIRRLKSGRSLSAPLEPIDRPSSPTKERSRSAIATGQALLRLAGRAAAHRCRATVLRSQWGLAYRFESHLPWDRPPIRHLEGFARLAPPKDKLWADPFPVTEDGRRYMFLEELPYKSRIGHISVMEFVNGSWTTPVPVIERDYHMSYPFPFRWKGDWYLMPETAAIRALEVYRARRFPLEWELHDRPLIDVPIVDATVENIDGQWWMFASVGEDIGTAWDSLYLFKGLSPLGPWTPHGNNPIRVDIRSSRPAGRLFRRMGRWYRPSQDCSHAYGYAVVINRIDHIGDDEYRETPVARLEPDFASGALGHHTFNVADGLSVIDVRTYRNRYPFLYPRQQGSCRPT